MKTMQIMDERLTLTESRVSSILSMQRGVHPVPVHSSTSTTSFVGGEGHLEDLQDGADEPLPIMRDIILHQQRQQLLDMKLASVAWPSWQEQQIHGGLQNHLHNHRGAEMDSKSNTNVSSANAVATSFMDIVDSSYDNSVDVGEENDRDGDDQEEENEDGEGEDEED